MRASSVAFPCSHANLLENYELTLCFDGPSFYNGLLSDVPNPFYSNPCRSIFAGIPSKFVNRLLGASYKLRRLPETCET